MLDVYGTNIGQYAAGRRVDLSSSRYVTLSLNLDNSVRIFSSEYGMSSAIITNDGI